MKIKNTHIWMGLMVVIFIVAILVSSYNVQDSYKEGYSPCENVPLPIKSLPNNTSLKDWNLTTINEALKIGPFGSIDNSDLNLVANVIDYFVNSGGVKILIGKINGTTTTINGTDFPIFGGGTCMSDTGTRMIRFITPQNKGKPNFVGNVPANQGSAGYDQCKQRANTYGATVFGLQYGGQCFIGDSNSVALGKTTNENGQTAIVLNSRFCGEPKGYGGGWSQNVYTKTPASSTTTPSQTYYYLESSSMDSFIKTLINGGYTDIKQALCHYLKDKNI